VPSASTEGWNCMPDNNAGSTCTINVGSVGAFSSGYVNFVVKTNNYPPVYTEISNTASIDDDHEAGTDINFENNSSNSVVIPVQYSNIVDPPVGYKTVTSSGDVILTWRMVWINNGNLTAEVAQIYDNVPANTTYINGSFTCEPRGSSTTISCLYDTVNNRVVWNGSIAADLGATSEIDALNEIILTYQVNVKKGELLVQNQASANWDNNGDGNVLDDIDAGQIPVSSDDPATLPLLDPTVWQAQLSNTSGPTVLPILFGFVMLAVLIYLKDIVRAIEVRFARSYSGSSNLSSK